LLSSRPDTTAATATRRELTLRALLTGMLLGAALTPCNIYSGLKIGWSFNMSITALLLAYVFWVPLSRALRRPDWSLYESNITQTTASSAASIISGGLVAPIPALALLSDGNLPLLPLTGWVFAVSFLGIWVAWYLRPYLIVQSALPFPAGVATAETMLDIFSHGREAVRRVGALLGAGTLAIGVKLVDGLLWQIPRWGPSVGLKKLTFVLDPSLLLLGFGAIIGIRAGLSLLLGAVLAWGVIAPELIAAGVVPGDALEGASWFGPLVEWLLWPGVTLMVMASLGSLLPQLVAFLIRGDQGGPGTPARETEGRHAGRYRLAGLLGAGALAVVLQHALFGIHWLLAILAIPLAFVLATVAARVVGETGIPPIGAIGKVAQLGYGVVAPGQTVTNLMTANVAGGAAGQCADLMNDFRAGARIGAHVPSQVIAQCFGVLTGALVGSWVYLLLIPDPQAQLLTVEWPAPAVATWKAVAETLTVGLAAIPASAVVAMLIAAPLGLALGVGEQKLPAPWKNLLPSGAATGLAFVIPAGTSLMMFFGALLAYVGYRLFPNWSKRFLLALAAGLIAGESLSGVASSIWSMT
jgi:uncharacterized oligopeptide transporter (OPT) family protein